ncbi:unnamed protein product [marine sediment metagenome]|uniref:Uncharacterized protein n=1 Tax=marine sediment metagenome TaxID=412755 RepID=X0YLG0_9ZZZZ
MRETGFSATQARRFSWHTPGRVTEVTNILKGKIDYLSKGYLGGVAERRGLSIDEVTTPYYRRQAKESIIEGLQKSEKTWEEWEKYGMEK